MKKVDIIKITVGLEGKPKQQSRHTLSTSEMILTVDLVTTIRRRWGISRQVVVLGATSSDSIRTIFIIPTSVIMARVTSITSLEPS